MVPFLRPQIRGQVRGRKRAKSRARVWQTWCACAVAGFPAGDARAKEKAHSQSLQTQMTHTHTATRTHAQTGLARTSSSVQGRCAGKRLGFFRTRDSPRSPAQINGLIPQTLDSRHVRGRKRAKSRARVWQTWCACAVAGFPAGDAHTKGKKHYQSFQTQMNFWLHFKVTFGNGNDKLQRPDLRASPTA